MGTAAATASDARRPTLATRARCATCPNLARGSQPARTRSARASSSNASSSPSASERPEALPPNGEGRRERRRSRMARLIGLNVMMDRAIRSSRIEFIFFLHACMMIGSTRRSFVSTADRRQQYQVFYYYYYYYYFFNIY